ncbi:MAG: tetratricopeptide repeat protein, partial [Candidatus Nanopelagicales bacterium]
MAKGWRGWPRGVALAIAAVMAGGLAAILSQLQAPDPLEVGLSLLVVGLGVLAELTQWWETSRAQDAERVRLENEQKAAEAEWQRRAAGSLRAWPAPLLSKADPLSQLGVARSLPLGAPGQAETLGAYVPRDVDSTAFEALRGHGLLLLLGDPGEGVTRTAYQVALGDPVDRTVVAPRAPGGVAEALTALGLVDRLAEDGPLLLWLDGINAFPPGSLTAPLLDQWRRKSPGLRVLATISSHAYGTWAVENRELLAAFGKPVHLTSAISAGERQRAVALYPERDFGHGIGAAFTGMSSLLTRLDAGDTQCLHDPPGAACPLSRQAVHAAVGWAGTGSPHPLTYALLGRLVAEIHRSPAPDPEHLQHAAAWGCGRVREGISLLSLHQEPGVVAPNEKLAELLLARGSTPPGAWIVALDDAASDPAAAGGIGYHAQLLLLAELARRGPAAEVRRRRVTEVEWLQEVTRRAWALIPGNDTAALAWIQRGLDAAETAKRPRGEVAALEAQLGLDTADHGPDHPEVAATLGNLGNAWYRLGHPGKARDLHQRALTIQ